LYIATCRVPVLLYIAMPSLHHPRGWLDIQYLAQTLR
jgi:hypothetical protein